MQNETQAWCNEFLMLNRPKARDRATRRFQNKIIKDDREHAPKTAGLPTLGAKLPSAKNPNVAYGFFVVTAEI